MSNQKSMHISLLEEFISFQDTTDKVKTLKLRRKVQKFVKSSDADNTQLIDVIRVLDLWVEEHEYNDFIHSFRIASPVAERISNLSNLDFFDIAISAHVVGYCKDYKATHVFAQKILSEVEKYQSHDRYQGVKLVLGLNVLHRLLRVKYFELINTHAVIEQDELNAIFTKYVNQVLELCGQHDELWEYKTVAKIRKALYEKNYKEVDEGLTLISEKGSYIMFKIIAEEINGYNAFAGAEKTKMQLNLQVGKNIRKIRKSKYLRIEDCAKALNMTPSVLQSIEQGKRSAHVFNLFKLSETYKLSLDEIVKGQTKPARKDEELPEDIKKLVNACKLLEKTDIDTLSTLANQLAKK